MFGLSLQEILRVVPAILVGLALHELAHAYVALRLGDDTAKLQGRITLNPLKHIDPFGFLMLLIAGFGWAKPVMIDRSKLRKPARDDILIALSGPLSNLLFALLLVLLLRGVLFFVPYRPVASIFLAFIAINVSLGLFNLLPLPPLDGSHVLFNLISPRSAAGAALFFKYGSYALLAIIVLERVLDIDILPIGKAVNAVVLLLLRLVGLA